MKTKFLVVSLISLFLISIVSAVMLLPVDEKAKEKGRADNSAVIEKADDHLVLTTPGLEKVVFIHYKKGYGRVCDYDGICEPELGENPSCADCKNGGGEPATLCYAFLGAKWKELPVEYVIDPDNPDGLSEEFVANAIYLGAEEWDAHTSAELFNDVYTIDYNSSWDDDAPDGRNELLFGDYPQEGVIAVTIIWGYFRGRPSSRKIVEFDILFDIDFTWGDATLNSTVMDLQNIATHELGHGVGLDDLYETVCAEETMYGYSDYGETKKRDLNAGDITGIQELYG
jgi:hypothetical protein